jgi:hypothetical protein
LGNYLGISLFSRNIVRVYGLLLGADTFSFYFLSGHVMNHAKYTFWLVCSCLLAELTVFSVISFGQTLPASQQLRLLQPNGKERLQSGSQYTIKWTGIDSARPVRLEYSTDNGASWKLITDKAVGGEYLWKPIPNEPSDSCLILATGSAADSTESVGRSLVKFQVPRSTSNYTTGTYWGSESASFNPDGTKILVTTFSQPLAGYYGWSQVNLEVRDGKTGAILYTLPPYVMDGVNFTRNGYWGWGYGSYGSWGTGSQGRWSPDGRLLLAQIADTVFGVYDAQTGTLMRSIAVPTQGNATRCIAMQWTAKGQEILATVQHRFFNPTNTNGYLDTVKIMMMRFSTNTGALANTPFRVSTGIITNSGCYGWWYGMGGISNDGEKRYTYANDSTFCVSGSPVIRSTRDNSLITTLPNMSGTWFYSWGWGGNNSLWSPNDSLILQFTSTSSDYSIYVINAQNGSIVQRINNSYNGYNGYYGGVQWSSDSRKILLANGYGYGYILGLGINRAPANLIVDVQTGTVQPILRNMQDNSYGWGGYGYGGWGGGYGYGNTNASGSSTVTWSPNGRFVAGFLWQFRSNTNPADNLLNTVGIWDSQTGCLLQTFRLPFPDGLTDNQKRTFYYTPLQWSADGKRLLLFSPLQLSNRTQTGSRYVNGQLQIDSTFGKSDYDGTALIASVNIDQIPCQEDRSDTVWTILPRGTLRVANVSFPTLQCGSTSSTVIFPIANTSLGPLSIKLPSISGANASDFSLLSINGHPPDSTTQVITLTTANYQRQLEVLFTPSDFGFRTAQMIFTDTSGTELERITLTGRKDTLAISPTNLRLNFVRVLQNSITNASVSFRNLSTLPLYWDGQMFSQTPSQQSGGGGQMGGQQFQSAAGSFRVDSIAPAMVAPGDSGRVYVTFLRTDKEGVFSDSSTVLRCGVTTSQLLVTAEIVPNNPRLEVDSLLDFGHLICETSSGATLRVRNTGGKLLRIFSAPTLNRDAFPISSERKVLEILPFDTLNIPLTFVPTSGDVTESAIILNSDDLRDTRRVVRLRGRKTL